TSICCATWWPRDRPDPRSRCGLREVRAFFARLPVFSRRRSPYPPRVPGDDEPKPKAPQAPPAPPAPETPRGATDGRKKSPGRRRWPRILLRTGAILAVLLVGLWIAAHRIPWVGSALADGLRAVIGTDAVAKIEDFVYGVEDRWNQFWRADEAPKAYWDVPEEPPPDATGAPPPTASAEAPAEPALPPFRPEKVGPLHAGMAAEGDGVWVPVAD